VDFEAMGESLKVAYAQAATGYRRDDEIEVTTRHHRRLKSILHEISGSFRRPISVLEAGCGTGRYFYCLKNVAWLVGMDISQDMLDVAEHPVCEERISAGTIELRCGNIHLAEFPHGTFDMIYSLGMFGNGCPVTPGLCSRFHDWLKPGGKLFFDTVDSASLPLSKKIRRRVRASIYPLLPRRLQEILDARHEGIMPLFDMSKRELKRLMRATPFSRFSVSSEVCESPLWRGVHLECHAVKGR
jgi:SAM-dependent methyltransferase